MVDIDWKAITTTKTIITVKPRLDPYSMLWDTNSSGDEYVTYGFNTKIHDAVIGGNVRDWVYGIDADGVVNRLAIKIGKSDSGEPFDSLLFSKKDINNLIDEWETSAEGTKRHPKKTDTIEGEDWRLYGDTKAKRGFNIGTLFKPRDDVAAIFGKQTRIVEILHSKADLGDAEKITLTGERLPYSKEAIQSILRRIHHWGMRGSVMLIGNADIQTGHILRITDKRARGNSILGMDTKAVKATITNFVEKFKDYGEKITESRNPPKSGYLGMYLFENLFFIWKIRHYLGPQGFWTKVWFVKQRDSLASTKSSIFKTMQKQIGKVEGD